MRSRTLAIFASLLLELLPVLEPLDYGGRAVFDGESSESLPVRYVGPGRWPERSWAASSRR